MEQNKPQWLRWMQDLISGHFARTDRPDLGRATMYQGTADRNKVAKRRAKNKVARKQRRVNRQRSK